MFAIDHDGLITTYSGPTDASPRHECSLLAQTTEISFYIDNTITLTAPTSSKVLFGNIFKAEYDARAAAFLPFSILPFPVTFHHVKSHTADDMSWEEMPLGKRLNRADYVAVKQYMTTHMTGIWPPTPTPTMWPSDQIRISYNQSPISNRLISPLRESITEQPFQRFWCQNFRLTLSSAPIIDWSAFSAAINLR